MNRPAAGAFGVFGVSHAARGAVLAAALAAPGMAQEPPHDPPIPGADGLGCSTNQANGNVGAGVNVIGEGWVFDYRGQSVLTDRFDHDSRTFSPPDFLYVPTAGDGTGSVFSTGDALLKVDLIDTASKNGYPFDLMLLYRSNRDVAWLEAFGQTGATSATVDLDATGTSASSTGCRSAGSRVPVRRSATRRAPAGSTWAKRSRRHLASAARSGPWTAALRSCACTASRGRTCSTGIATMAR